MLLKGLVYILLFNICVTANAQFVIKHNDVEINYSTTGVKYAFLYTSIFSDSTLKSIPLSNWNSLTNTAIPISFVAYTTWLKVPLKSILSYGKVDYLNINSPHVNYLKCWITRKDSIVQSFVVTGDDVVYSSRPIPSTTFVFPISGIDLKDCDIIIAADKRFTKLDLPITFCTTDYYINETTKKGLLIGLLIGGCFFLLLYNSYLFITIKEWLYLWYSIYLCLIIIYIAADAGILFKYLFPNYTSLNDIIRPSILALVEFPLLLFFTQLFNIKNLFPKFYLYNKILLILYLILFIIAMSSVNSGNFETHGFWLKVINILGPIILLFILFQSIYFLLKKIKFAFFAFMSYSGFSFFMGLFSLQQREVIPSNYFTQYANYWAIFFEAILVALLLAWRYKLYKEDAEMLLKENIEQQEQIFIETAAWQEKEMQRISSLLHDTVGANLGFLRLEMDNMTLTTEGRNKIAEHITRIGNEVRSMSHSFSPLILMEKGLFVAIADMVNLIKINSNIDLQFEWIGKQKQIGLQYEIIIYRITQEILQNLLKHANAKTAFLQIMLEQNLISIYAEDDGIGLKNNELKNGVGLKSIENLVKVLKGSFWVESKAQEGFSISIEFNQPNNEKIQNRNS
jgi:two-component system, sensor histidine kinase LadS